MARSRNKKNVSMRKPKSPRSMDHHYQAGDVYSFRTSPLSEFGPQDTGRYAALKVLGVKDGGVYYVILDGVFDHHPTPSEVSRLPWLNNTRPGRPGPACRCSDLEWQNDLCEFRYVGSVTLSEADVELMGRCRAHGLWSGADAEREWRWRNDRAAYEQEVEAYRQARDARFAAERERYEKRLKTLTWEVLLAEQPFSRWDTHPPFPPPEFVAAARDRVRSAMLELQSLGSKPRKPQVRAVLKTCIEWFNAKDIEFGGVIETEEREDICAVLEELAFVARQRTLVDEIEGWRHW
jgi:hypothetical protein